MSRSSQQSSKDINDVNELSGNLKTQLAALAIRKALKGKK